MSDSREVGLYEKVLGLGLKAPEPKVRASGGVVLWRWCAGSAGGAGGAGGAGRDIEVYWVERSKKLAFLPGFHAFPGGGRSRKDLELEVTGEPVGVEDAPIEAGMPLDADVEVERQQRMEAVKAKLTELVAAGRSAEAIDQAITAMMELEREAERLAWRVLRANRYRFGRSTEKLSARKIRLRNEGQERITGRIDSIRKHRNGLTISISNMII